MSWVHNVLARATDRVDDVVAVNAARRIDCDTDIEEADILRGIIEAHVAEQRADVYSDAGRQGQSRSAVDVPDVFYISVTDMAHVIGKAMNQPHESIQHWTGKLRGHVAAGRLSGIHYLENTRFNGSSTKRNGWRIDAHV